MKPIKIILVDDDDGDYVLFTEVLDYQTYHTTLHRVTDVDVLMNRLDDVAHELPDIIFLEMNLPKRNGIEILQILRSKERLKDVVIAIQSTTYLKSAANLLYEHGANFYIVKPITFEELQRVIETALAIISNEEVKYLRTEENYLIA